MHAREIDELERTVARKDREKRNIEEELRDRADEATRDREAIRELKVCSHFSSLLRVGGD